MFYWAHVFAVLAEYASCFFCGNNLTAPVAIIVFDSDVFWLGQLFYSAAFGAFYLAIQNFFYHEVSLEFVV